MKWSLPEGVQSWKEFLEKYQVVFLVLMIGIMLMLLPGNEREYEPASPSTEVESVTQFDLDAFEQRLSKSLSKVEGAGETSVLLTLKSGSRQILAQNLEQDGDHTISTAVTVGGSGSGQEVVPLQTVGPQFQGALIICPGGEQPQVRLRLVAAVAALTGLSSNHISVCKST